MLYRGREKARSHFFPNPTYQYALCQRIFHCKTDTTQFVKIWILISFLQCNIHTHGSINQSLTLCTMYTATNINNFYAWGGKKSNTLSVHFHGSDSPKLCKILKKIITSYSTYRRTLKSYIHITTANFSGGKILSFLSPLSWSAVLLLSSLMKLWTG